MGTKSVCDLSCGAMHEFALVLDKAGFNADLVQEVINSRGNKKAKAMYAALKSEAEVDPRFQSLTEFDLVVPADFDHRTCLVTFQREHGREFAYYNSDLTDQHYARATTKLAPGRRFKVKAFQITETMTSDDCLVKIRAEKGVLVGVQGLTLAYQQGKKRLPVGRWSVSFDKKNALRKDGAGLHRVPYVNRDSGGGFHFDLGYFEGDWDGHHVLLVFCDLETSA